MKTCVLLVLVVAPLVLGQLPSPCITPVQMSMRASQFDHENNQVNRFHLSYDATLQRKVFFEEENEVIPGRQFHEYLILNQQNVMYDYNMKTKECTKSVPRPWRPFAIPNNATFENEFNIGGPQEQITATEWSDRIPFRQREYWVGVFSMKYCYPVREVIIQNANISSTIVTNFYDIVEGITNPNDFIPPPECAKAKWAPTSLRYYW